MNITVDESVHREIQARGDFNASGAANEYFKRRLVGDDKTDAELRIKINRHEDKAESLREQAELEEQKADRKRRKLKERKQERREELNDILERIDVRELNSSTVVETPDSQIEQYAEKVEMSPAEIKQEAISHHTSEPSQRHYQ
jgi:hypothetical protein